MTQRDATHEQNTLVLGGLRFSRVYPWVQEFLGICLGRDNRIVRLKTGQAGQGQAQCRAGLGQIQGGAGRLGFEAEQGYVWQNQDPCRTALGQAQDRALLWQNQSSA